MWTPNSVIRNRKSGRAFLVVHVYGNCTIMVNLNDKGQLVMPLALLQRDYHYYARDTEMENTDTMTYAKDWHYREVRL